MPIEDLNRFYHPEAKAGISLPLDDEESRHAKVVRLKEGDAVHLVDGKGNLFAATIEKLKRGCVLLVRDLLISEPQPSKSFILAVAPTKNTARMEWLVEKATEIGMTEFVPIQCEHSERVHLRIDRLTKIALSAMKQSKSLHLPVIHPITPFSNAITLKADQKWIAHCRENTARKMARSITDSMGSTLVMIGPEGDFSESEIEMALKANFEPISFGDKRLRTETAALAACVLFCS